MDVNNRDTREGRKTPDRPKKLDVMVLQFGIE